MVVRAGAAGVAAGVQRAAEVVGRAQGAGEQRDEERYAGARVGQGALVLKIGPASGLGGDDGLRLLGERGHEAQCDGEHERALAHRDAQRSAMESTSVPWRTGTPTRSSGASSFSAASARATGVVVSVSSDPPKSRRKKRTV